MPVSFLIVLILAVDLLSKYLVRAYLAGGPPISVIGEFFTLTYVENSGAAFGLLSQKAYGPAILLFFALLFTLGLIYLLRQLQYEPLRWGLALVIAGSLGNALDRALRGFVTDFLTFKFGDWYFPSFNIADSAIVIGCILLAALILWDHQAQAELEAIFVQDKKGPRHD